MKGHLNCSELSRLVSLCKTASFNNAWTIKTVFIRIFSVFSLFYRNSSRFPSFPAYSSLSHSPFLPFRFPPTMPAFQPISTRQSQYMHTEPLYSSGGSRKATMLSLFISPRYISCINAAFCLPCTADERVSESEGETKPKKPKKKHSISLGYPWNRQKKSSLLSAIVGNIYSSYFPTLSADDLAAERSAREAKWYSASREISCLSGRAFYLCEDDDNDISYNYDAFLIIFYTF